MKLVEFDWHPSDRQLRQFGAICLFALPLVAWLWNAGPLWIGSLAAIGLTLAVVGYAVPQAIKPIFLATALVTTPIGMVIGELAMLLIYFGVLLPTGILLRLIKRDPLQMKSDPEADTYWQPKASPKDAASYYRQF